MATFFRIAKWLLGVLVAAVLLAVTYGLVVKHRQQVELDELARQQEDYEARKAETFAKILALPDLKNAVLVSGPVMKDTTETDESDGQMVIATWLRNHSSSWVAMNELERTTLGDVLKDSAGNRGKMFCTPGYVVQIRKRGEDWAGIISTDNDETISFHAVGSSNGVAAHAVARFCGIATGINRYTSTAKKEIEAVQMVGMFDVALNRPPSPPFRMK